MGDDDHSDFTQDIISTLAALPCQVYLMHGNRDFLIGDEFCNAAGATLLEDPTVIELPQGPALLMHGDSLCTLDAAYMAARVQLRSPAFQADFLSKSLTEREAFARQLRGKSKEHTRETAEDIMDVTPEEVVNAMSDHQVKLFIHGHTHRPAVHNLDVHDEPAIRYVLGDWHNSMQYLAVNNEGIELRKYSLS